MQSNNPNIARWHKYMLDRDLDALDDLLHDDAVFVSPVVHTPQKGKAITKAYLTAAAYTLGGDSFEYKRVFDCGSSAVLEFTLNMDGIHINGVDMIEWDENGKITHFQVMIRPLQAIQAVHAAMGRMLESMKKNS